MQPQFVRELTAIVRNQVPSGRRSVLKAYGEVIYRAWRQGAGACLYEVEHSLIQVRRPTEPTLLVQALCLGKNP